MKDIKLGKAMLIWIGIQIVSMIVMFAMFGEEIERGIIALVSETIVLLVLFKVGKINKEIIIERISDFKNKFKFKEIITIVITQIFISIALVYIISSLIYIFNPEYAIELMKEEPNEALREIVADYIPELENKEFKYNFNY